MVSKEDQLASILSWIVNRSVWFVAGSESRSGGTATLLKEMRYAVSKQGVRRSGRRQGTVAVCSDNDDGIHSARRVAIERRKLEVLGVRIRAYEARDAGEISRLFYETVHAVNRADYSPEQLRAWAPEVPEPALWQARMQSRCTLVADEEGEIVAFAELEEDGHLDTFYCRHDRVGGGIGSRLYGAVEHKALEWKLTRIFTEASITARPFFQRQGFLTVREQTVTRHGIELTNFVMEKTLKPVESRDPNSS